MLDEQVRRAKEWYVIHRDHVDQIVKWAIDSFPPSGSDASHPAVWKEGHWKWFFKVYGKPS